MKKITMFLMVFLPVLMMEVPAMAEMKQLTIDYDFNAPPLTNMVQPVSFDVLVDRILVCSESDPLARTTICVVEFTSADVNGQQAEADITMRAVDNRGMFSDLSEVYVVSFDISDLPPLPAPTITDALTSNPL